jgi:hypothetical protein
MAKRMEFTAADGTTHASSYWTIAQVNVSLIQRQATIVFYGYKDAAARLAGKQAVGEKKYAIPTPAFIAYFTGVVAGNDQLLNKAYQYAVETEDVVDTVDPETGETTYKSFFEGASDV